MYLSECGYWMRLICIRVFSTSKMAAMRILKTRLILNLTRCFTRGYCLCAYTFRKIIEADKKKKRFSAIRPINLNANYQKKKKFF